MGSLNSGLHREIKGETVSSMGFDAKKRLSSLVQRVAGHSNWSPASDPLPDTPRQSVFLAPYRGGGGGSGPWQPSLGGDLRTYSSFLLATGLSPRYGV